MKLVEILSVLCYAMHYIPLVVGSLMVTNVSSMPTDLTDHYDDEYSGSGNNNGNSTFSTSQIVYCVSECNDTDFMIDKKFLVTWLSLDSQHGISKLSVAANNLRDDTQYLSVSETSCI